MSDTVDAPRPRLGWDRGFTMIEVLAAIVILGIVTTGATFLSIQALQATETQQRRQVAVAVATEAMESVTARVASNEAGTGVSYLLGGRSAASVDAAWVANATAPGVGQTYPAYDPTAGATSAPRIQITRDVIRNGTTYSVTTLIGWCFQRKTASDCVKVSGFTATPPATPTSPVPRPDSSWANRLIRVITIVKWSAGAQCASTPCQVQTMTLVDGSTDLEWNSK